MSDVILDINGVLEHLPQRPPFLFVDQVLEFERGVRMLAIKNVTMNEPFFAGHFPKQPIFPGVLIIEALAQASTVFAFMSTKEDPQKAPYLFAGIDNARFKRLVQPGDQLALEVSLVKHRGPYWKMSGVARVGEEIACSAELTSFKGKE